MALEFLRNKWNTWFQQLDVNKDGKLSLEDSKEFTDTFIRLQNITGSEAEQVQERMEYTPDHDALVALLSYIVHRKHIYTHTHTHTYNIKTTYQ